MPKQEFKNPFRPGAGQMPPYLAGRDEETQEFARLLKQEIILDNMVLTGLRGTGKTVLLETFKPMAIHAGWLWAGTDLSESTSVSEETLALRLLTDLAIVTSSIVVARQEVPGFGFRAESAVAEHKLDYDALVHKYKTTPGLVADKLKRVLEDVWAELGGRGARGMVFAYDEAQNMSDHPQKEQYPLSLLLDVFQSIQRKSIPFMLVLTGLPTLFPKLVETRTFSERMFRVVFLDRLSKDASRDAISKPIKAAGCPINLSDGLVGKIVAASAGYPYFIQFICREVYDVAVQKIDKGQELVVPMTDIVRKLDADFFAGRWAKASDRQRDLLRVIASLPDCDEEFTVHDVVEASKTLARPFSASHVNQMLAALGKIGLVCKNRHGKYSFAVPLLGQFILRQPQ
ncbi:MAG: ATP-binding protein [Phycisphaerae bacterium]|nr:ATP-binding protein [Phycisphaerae bacterium]